MTDDDFDGLVVWMAKGSEGGSGAHESGSSSDGKGGETGRVLTLADGERVIGYEVSRAGDYVALKLPEQGLEVLFEPLTAIAFGLAMQAAGKDITDEWAGTRPPVYPAGLGQPHGRGLCTDGRWSRSKVGRLNAVDVLGRPIARGEGIGRPR